LASSAAPHGAPAPVEQLRAVEEKRGRVEYFLRRLEDRRTEVLAVAEDAERERRRAEADAERARRREAQAAVREREAAQKEEAIRREREAASRELGPTLRLRARLGGSGYLQAMVSAPSLGDYLWRRRMVDRVLAQGLRTVRRIDALEREAAAAKAQVEAERTAAEQARAEALEAAESARHRRAAQDAVLENLARREAGHLRVVSELEAARRRVLEAIESAPRTAEGLGGFGARRGHLPIPAGGRVDVGFGLRTDPGFKTVIRQKGVDIRAPEGAPILVPHSAQVAFAGWFRGYGNLVMLDHGEGYYTLYAHLAELRVARGERVDEGSVMGTVGDTGSLKGPYLYFEIRSGQKALDPKAWFAR